MCVLPATSLHLPGEDVSWYGTVTDSLIFTAHHSKPSYTILALRLGS